MEMTAADVMTRNVISVNKSTTILELVEIFFSKKVSGVPVVDDKGALVGIISKTDLVTHGLEKELKSILGNKMPGQSEIGLPDFDYLLGPEPSTETVDRIMSSPVVTAAPDTKVTKLVKIMLDNKIHRIIIVEKENLVGIITSMDLLKIIETGE